MIRITIGNETRDAKDADQHWLCNQINGRREHQQSVCVRVTIQEGDVDVILQTPGCSGTLQPVPSLSASEQKIVDLWRERHLDQPGFSCDNVHAFLVQLQRRI